MSTIQSLVHLLTYFKISRVQEHTCLNIHLSLHCISRSLPGPYCNIPIANNMPPKRKEASTQPLKGPREPTRRKNTQPSRPSSLRTVSSLSETPSPPPGGRRRDESEKPLTARQKKAMAKSSVTIKCERPRLRAKVLSGEILGLTAARTLSADDFWEAYRDHLVRLGVGTTSSSPSAASSDAGRSA